MKINGKMGSAQRRANTCDPRVRTKPTKAERKLKERQKSFDGLPKTMKGVGPVYSGYRRPGSLQVS